VDEQRHELQYEQPDEKVDKHSDEQLQKIITIYDGA